MGIVEPCGEVMDWIDRELRGIRRKFDKVGEILKVN
jgi:hypothetical protein